MLRGTFAKDAFVVALLIFGLCLMGAGNIISEGGVSYLPTYEKKWAHIVHESGAEYIVRIDTIVGFYQPIPGESLRNELILSNGHSIGTSMTFKEFNDVLVEESDGRGIEVEDVK